MAIQKISIKNFTVFKNIDINFCDRVNILIGENGTGKTHLLKLLYAAHLARLENSPSLNSVFGEDFDIALTVTNLLTDEAIISKAIPKEAKINSQVKAYLELEDGGLEQAFFQLEDGSVTEAYLEINDGNNSFVSVVSNKPYNPVFIPAKDMLTHGRLEKDYIERNLPFDRTLIEILNKAGVSTVRNINNELFPIADSISKIIGGTIVYKNDRYYTQKANGTLVGFDMEAEGYKRLGLIYRLIATGYFKNGSILLWDEPESNINPKRIAAVVTSKSYVQFNRCDIYYVNQKNEIKKIPRKRRKNITPMATSIII